MFMLSLYDDNVGDGESKCILLESKVVFTN